MTNIFRENTSAKNPENIPSLAMIKEI